MPNLNRRLQRGDSDFQDGYPSDGVQKARPLSSDSIDKRSHDNASQCKSYNCIHSIIHYNYIYLYVYIYTHNIYHSFLYIFHIAIRSLGAYRLPDIAWCSGCRYANLSLSLSCLCLIKACMTVAYLPTYIHMYHTQYNKNMSHIIWSQYKPCVYFTLLFSCICVHLRTFAISFLTSYYCRICFLRIL